MRVTVTSGLNTEQAAYDREDFKEPLQAYPILYILLHMYDEVNVNPLSRKNFCQVYHTFSERLRIDN